MRTTQNSNDFTPAARSDLSVHFMPVKAKAVARTASPVDIKIIMAAALYVLIMALSIRAHAKTNTSEALDKLKINSENSEFNHKQYQDNLDVVNKNVEQSDKAVNELKKMKKQLISNTQNVDKNKKSLEAMSVDITKMKQKEQLKIAQEEKQMAEVKKILEKLESNKKKREENLVSYDQMTLQVQQESKDWDTQVQQMSTLQKELDTKEQSAQAEKATWTTKRKDYEAEAKKWQSQSRASRDSYEKLKKMKDQ